MIHYRTLNLVSRCWISLVREIAFGGALGLWAMAQAFIGLTALRICRPLDDLGATLSIGMVSLAVTSRRRVQCASVVHYRSSQDCMAHRGISGRDVNFRGGGSRVHRTHEEV